MQNVLLLTCITRGAPIGIHGEMCSHCLALHNVLLLGYIEKCALIGLHCKMCSYRLACKNVLLTAKFQFDFTSTAEYTLVEL